ncbi:N-acetylmuramoyl-L-alanine amidase family protein [Winogradskyella undariae]|uniref:N-acetylmuramoyl-L-alanine amidase family protein n=1 Tax=Winogradskyella undariae TaxID=1285465 RepID=UPI0020C2DAB4|nr:N-acetylmuramoyl-L-alanine amidase [Winogradskyella undariae]
MMYTLNQIIVLLLCLVFFNLSYTQNEKDQENKTTVVIDPGHGGLDSGAIGVNGVYEKDIVLNIAMEIIRLNNIMENPMEIYLTRYSDTLISIRNRTELAKKLKADVLLSIHCNASRNPKAEGAEIYIWDGESDFSRASILLAYHLQRVFSKKIGLKSRGVKFANFQVLRGLYEFCPAVLVELGFLSHFDEATFLADKKYSSYIALVIIEILWKYFEK